MVEVREVKTISVELAIRRELAYRKKVAAFLSEKQIAALLPLEVPSPEIQDDQLLLLALEGPKTEDEVEYNESDDQVPLLALEGPKSEDGVEDIESDDQVPLLALEDPKSEDEVEIGESSLTAKDKSIQVTEKAEERGSRLEIHEKKRHGVHPSTSSTFQNPSRRPHSTLNWTNSAANGVPPSASDSRPSRSPSARSLGSFFCHLCKVDCTSSFNHRNHIRGHKHKAKLKYKQLKSNKNNKNRHFFCEVCEIWCVDERSLQLHLDGRKHMVKLHEAESADQP